MANHHFFIHLVVACTFKKTGDRPIDFPVSWVVEHIGDRPPAEPKLFHDLGLI